MAIYPEEELIEISVKAHEIVQNHIANSEFEYNECSEMIQKNEQNVA